MEDDDIDIYEDLPNFEIKDTPVNNKKECERCSTLEVDLTELRAELKASKEFNDTISINASSLMKTAKAEIARKDRMIAQLRQELDNMTFRRGNHGVPKKNLNDRAKHRSSERNTERKEPRVPSIKEEARLEHAVEESSHDSSSDEAKNPAISGPQDTVFGLRLRLKIMEEEETERKRKEVAKNALSKKPSKPEGEENKKYTDTKVDVKREAPSEYISNATEEKKVVDVSSVPVSTGDSLQINREDDNSWQRSRAVETKGSDKGGATYINLEHKRGKTVESRHSREEPWPRHGNYNERRYDFEKSEIKDYSKISTKYTEYKRTSHSREDYWRMNQDRGESSPMIYRSHNVDRRYNDKRVDRDRMDKSRGSRGNRGKRWDGRPSWEDDNLMRWKKGMNDRSEYGSCNDDQLSERNYMRQAYGSRSPEKSRSSSGGRTRDAKFEKDELRSRSSRSSRSTEETDAPISAKSTIECDEKRQRTHSKDFKEWNDMKSKKEERLAKSSRRSRSTDETDKLISVKNIIESDEKRRRTQSKDSKESNDTKFEKDERSSRSTVETDELINVKSTIESGERKLSEPIEIELTVHDPEPEASTELPNVGTRGKESNEKISTEVAVNGSLSSTEGQGDKNHEEMTDSAVEVHLEKNVGGLDAPGNLSSVALKNGADDVSILSTIPEPAVLGSQSFREEKIENIEKFIKDYRENEHPWVPTANGESEEREKSSDSTCSIVDTLSMDIEDFPLDKCIVVDDPPKASTMDAKNTAESSTSKPPKTRDDERISATPGVFEIPETGASTEKHSTVKAVGKEIKRRSRISCTPIISRYSRKKPVILNDSAVSQCIARSESSDRIVAEADDTSNKGATPSQRIATQKLSTKTLRTDDSTNTTDSRSEIGKKLDEDVNNTVDKNLNILAVSKTMTDARDNAPMLRVALTRHDASADRKNENADDSSAISVSTKVDAAPKSTNVPVEQRETRSALKPILAPVLNTELRLSNRKRPLPKEGDSHSKTDAKQCTIVLTAKRRRRPAQFEDSCTVLSLVPNINDFTNR